MRKKVAYQGITGSFSSVAARKLFGNDVLPIETTRFRDIFEHVARGEAEFGVVPIENALAGSVHENYDLLAAYSCFITAEVYCPVQLNILSCSPGTKLSDIRQVISHPKALEQCSQFLEQHEEITQLVFSDTAGAAKYVSELKDVSAAAIASEEAATHYNLNVVARSVQNHALNMTRFFAISASDSACSSATKCSLILSLNHQPGSLYQLLGEISALGINLTKIESRPIVGQPFQYAFHLDLQCEAGHEAELRLCAEKIAANTLTCRALGFYSAAEPQLKTCC
jgi:prephenate dehydratase